MSPSNCIVSRRTALSALLLSAVAAVSANAKTTETKFTWWAILIMMVGIVVVFTVVLLIYFCCFRKEQPDEKEVSEANEPSHDSGAGVPPAINPENNEEQPRNALD